MKKIIFLGIILCATLSIHCADTSTQPTQLTINIYNQSDTLVLMNFVVPHEKQTVGSYGNRFIAHETKVVAIPEFFWFDKVAIGGIKVKNKKSQVRLVDVLKHSLPTKVEISIPNQPTQSFSLPGTKYTLTINPGTNTDTLSIQISPANSNSEAAQQL